MNQLHIPLALPERGRKTIIDRADDQRELKEIMDALDKRDAEIKSFAAKADAEIKDHGKILAETKAALDKIVTDSAGAQARLMEVEQKLARRGGSEGAAEKSIGERFTASESFRNLQASKKGRARLELKAVTDLTSLTTGTGGVGVGIRPSRIPGIISSPDRPMTIRDLLAPGRTESSSIEFVQESGFQNNAAPVAEGTTKPQSDLSFELKTTNVRTIAHWIRASRQVLSDIPLLQSYIDGRLRYGLAYAEEQQLLFGDGTDQNLLGLMPQATDFDYDLKEATDTSIDVIRRAALQVRTAEYRASGVILNPQDWASIELSKDGEGRYIFVNVQVGATMQLWRLPVVDTNAMPQGQFMVGAFNIAASVIDREEASVEVSTEDGTNFVSNMVTILAEERVALAVFRPQSFVAGYLSDGGSPQ